MNQKKSDKSLWVALSFFVLYTSALFGNLGWLITNSIDNKIKPIEKLLTNHITETNKKIETLNTETNKKIDKLSDRIDQLSNRFDKLYELLLKQKK